jgi:hypothetical protein
MRNIFLFVVLASLLASCNEARKIQKAKDVLAAHRPEAAEFCATTFPNVDSVGKADTVFVPANNHDFTGEIDSLNGKLSEIDQQRQEDSAKAARSQKDCQQVVAKLQGQIRGAKDQSQQIKTVYLPCKPDTIKISVPHYIENTAKVEMYKNQAAATSQKLDDTRGKLATRTGIMWFLIIAVALYVLGRIYSSKLPFRLP